MQLLRDVADGLKHIHSLELVYRDLKSDKIALYQGDSCLVCAVIIDFRKCLHVSSCTTYSLTDNEYQIYHPSQLHIPPGVVDGACKPSTASDIP